MNSNKKRVKKGFTLLEILLVIAAIGILSAIVLVAINPNRQLAQVRNAQRRVDINTIYKALEQYIIDTGSYPEGITAEMQDICINENTTNCLNLEVLAPEYVAGIPIDPAGVSYRVGINIENNRVRLSSGQSESGQSVSINLCPKGYIKVPGNNLYGTKDFCAMKYEAKAVNINNPTVGLTSPTIFWFQVVDNNALATISSNGRTIASVPSGFPIGNLSQTTAISYCNNINASLMNNNEWMTIARNIEEQSVNWTGGIVGSGGLYRGLTNGPVQNSNTSAQPASSDDENGYFGTDQTFPGIKRRTYILSNGEVIWDLSGSHYEWLSDSIMGEDKPNGNSNSFIEWTIFNQQGSYGSLNYNLLRPSDINWGSSQNIGMYWSGGNLTGGPYAFARGESHWGGGNAGLFALRLDKTISERDGFIGFRCVVR
jgi:general secretion pathway protein G